LTFSDLDKQALFLNSDRIEEIGLDLKARIEYFVLRKNYSPLEFLLGTLLFASHGVVAFSEDDPTKERDFVDLFKESINLSRNSQKEGIVRAFWPDGTEVK